MAPTIVIDDRPVPAPLIEPDAHGQAALLLTESLIHALVDRSALTVAQAIEVIEIAQEVKMRVATAGGESARRIQDSLDLLSKMAASFEADRD